MSDTSFKIFIGYDSKEPLAYDVFKHSILRHAKRPVEIIPLVQPELRERGIYSRERSPTESTEFSITRFLVPFLSNYEGVSLFVDCDMLVKTDIHELYDIINAQPDRAVYVAKHNYVPSTNVKFLNNIQTAYPRKNWSSVMVFNNALCKTLTPEYVNTATGLELHRFMWLPDDKLIGELPLEWNWLVGEYPLNPEAKLLHYTLGGPWYDEQKQCDHADLWEAEHDLMNGGGLEA